MSDGRPGRGGRRPVPSVRRTPCRGRGSRSAVTGALACALVLTALAPATVAGQGRLRSAEARLLREAAALESRGDYRAAEEALQRLLTQSPGSSGGLFALERVLRAQGDVAEILPAIRAYLEEDPESAGVRSLALRVLVDVDSLDAMRDQAEVWLALDPTEEVAYREIARAYELGLGRVAATELLLEGRRTIGDDQVFALELGDLLARSGDTEGAAREWATAVGDDGGQAATVSRRIDDLPTDRWNVGVAVVEALAASDRLARRTAGARLALDLGMEDRATELVRDVADKMDARARPSFLADAARRAREQGMVALASWAYDQLGDEATSPAERRQFDQRIVDVALTAGDTITAVDAQWRLVESFSPRSVDRRRETARAIRLEASRSDRATLLGMLDDFRETFPNAPELDGLAATVAAALQARGDDEGAAEVLEGVDGPLASMERGYLLLGAGEIDDGRAALLLALTGLPPAEATPVIQYAGLLGRVSTETAAALAAAGVTAHRGRAGEAATELADGVGGFPEEERAPILAEAARLAEAGGEADVAAGIRTRLVEEHPDAVETAEAALALARHHARSPDGVDEAIRLLEDLIARRPNAAIVPDARLELQRLRNLGEA